MQQLLINRLSKLRQYIYSVTLIVLVSGMCLWLQEFIGYRVVAFILLLAVSVLAVTLDILPVLVAAALSAFTWDFFFIPPRYTLHVENTEDSILLIMYFVIALINGVLTSKIRQIEKETRLKEERANSIKLYNTILNSLSHELRTPIATIIGATDNLRSNKNLNTENKMQLITEISKASLRLNQQVENLLNISRLESGHIQPKNDWCDISELIYEVVKRVEENSNYSRKIGISVSNEIPLCFLDEGMLDQVLYNLLNNAAIHTDVSAAIDISATCHADLLEIMIEDSGKGFTDREMKRVFNKFSRKKEGPSGSGLGLSIVKGFTEALGGAVSLNKSGSGGASFTILIPVKIAYFNSKV